MYVVEPVMMWLMILAIMFAAASFVIILADVFVPGGIKSFWHYIKTDEEVNELDD